MKTNPRFLKSILKTSSEVSVEMPWARGARRAEFIARRNGQTTTRKTA